MKRSLSMMRLIGAVMIAGLILSACAPAVTQAPTQAPVPTQSPAPTKAPVNTQGNLNVERIGAMGIPLPPITEQTQIVQRVGWLGSLRLFQRGQGSFVDIEA